jgi:hypothetical protein
MLLGVQILALERGQSAERALTPLLIQSRPWGFSSQSCRLPMN